MPTDVELCPLCGQRNRCSQVDPTSNGEACWCFSAPISAAALARLSAEQIDKSCLCPNCAKGVAACGDEPKA
ncbi:cysteine-rich CWC family protein [Pseudomonas sp. GV071]|jgi:hypothetical protein|uniref:cysteine-rich CWC family protein n=1 Tax=Pseudomonas sp. GV071 TaxID=2135754 RepID=UPI000D382B47|nr:cysteine-rich CWC family protein [Pseudomonas sp. GV071]